MYQTTTKKDYKPKNAQSASLFIPNIGCKSRFSDVSVQGSNSAGICLRANCRMK